MDYERRLLDALPFLERFPDWLAGSIAVSVGLDRDRKLLETLPVASLHGEDRRELALALAEIPFSYVSREPIGQLLPDLALLNGEQVSWGDLTVRPLNVLKWNNTTEWAKIRTLSLDEILKLRNLGEKSAREVFRLAIEKSLEVASASSLGLPTAAAAGGPSDEGPVVRHSIEPPEIAPPDEAIIGALKTISAWAAGEHSAGTVVEALNLASTVPTVPIEVEKARDALTSLNPRAFGGEALGRFDVDLALTSLFSHLEERELDVLLSRELFPGRRSTLESLAVRYGVTRERIRQLEGKGMRTLRRLLSQPEYGVLQREGHRLRLRLGAAFRPEMMPALALDDVGAHPSDPKTARDRILLWLAGPYRLDNQWLVVEPSWELGTKTSDLLLSCSERGIVDQARAREGLFELGINEELQDQWVRSIHGFRFLDPHLVVWDGTASDKAAVVLQVYQRAMTADELASTIGRTHGTMVNALASDDRFRRLGPHHFGLREWPGDDYSGIVDQIEEEIQRLGGEAEMPKLVSSIASKFGVSESSVRSFMSDPRFVRPSIHTLALRDDPVAPIGRQIQKTKRCFRISGKWAYRMTITRDTLRGSGLPIPVTLAAQIGLTPRAQLALDSSFGEVRFSWPSIQPAVGSLRAVAEGLGGAEGDYLYMIIAASSRLEFSLTRRQDLDYASPGERLLLEVGGTGASSATPDRVAVAVGLDVDSSWGAVRSRFVERGENDLATLVDRREKASGAL